MEVTKPFSEVMSTVSVPTLHFSPFSQNRGSRNHHLSFRRNLAFWTMSRAPEFMSLKLSSPHIKHCEALVPSDHDFESFQPPEEDEDPIQDKSTSDELQQFVAREASLDEEYYGAAWLRAQIHFEHQPNLRHLDNFKLQFAEQEFTAIKRRSKMQFGQKSVCIIMVRKEEKNVKPTVLESMAGTVDVYIRRFLHGETFPRESMEAHIFPFVQKPDSIVYGYVANLCVAKSARRQGLASTMLRLAIGHSLANGADHVYVHVDRSNEPALKLYKELGFQVVQEANLQLEKKHLYLLRLGDVGAPSS